MQALTTNEIQNLFTEPETEKAFQVARQNQLPVLVDFWAPGCKGCKKMEITTYKNGGIISYIDKHFVFVKYDITNRGGTKMSCSPILWTPTFIVFANDGSEIRKTTGYLSDLQFEAEMEIGRALALLRKAHPQLALNLLGNFIEKATSKISLPEALYWSGVASYFLNKRNAGSLAPFWEKLIADHPESIWAERADCLNITL